MMGPVHVPVLVVVSGLPGTGKTTVARRVAREERAAYVRIDTVETAIGRAEGACATSNGWDDAPGYVVGHAVARDQLAVGLDVVVEAVNALEARRAAWRDVGRRAGAHVVEVEVTCSDIDEHRRRVESREPDLEGLRQPTWAEVVAREHEPWTDDHLLLDTAVLTVEESVRTVRDRIAAVLR